MSDTRPSQPSEPSIEELRHELDEVGREIDKVKHELGLDHPHRRTFVGGEEEA